MFCKGGPIDHFANVPGPVAQYSADSEYNAAYITLMDISHFRMLNN